jgi:hypothetical protein
LDEAESELHPAHAQTSRDEMPVVNTRSTLSSASGASCQKPSVLEEQQLDPRADDAEQQGDEQ